MTARVLRVRAEMPVEPPILPRAPGWWIAAAGTIAVMIFSAIRTLLDGRYPSGYYASRDPELWTYPTEQITFWLSVTGAECLGLCLVLRARMAGSLLARCLLLAVLMFLTLFVLAPLGMHAGTPFPEHIGWVVLETGWLLVFAIALTVVNLSRWLRGRLRA